MITNPDKFSCTYLARTNNDSDTLNFNEVNLNNSDKETILKINIDQKLSFNGHIKTLCTKSSTKCAHFSEYQTIFNKNEKPYFIG